MRTKRANFARILLWMVFLLMTLLIEGVRHLTAVSNTAQGFALEANVLARIGQIAGIFLFFMLCFAVDRMLTAIQGE